MINKTFETEFGGKKLIAEFNDWAENANGSVTLRYGETVIFVTAVIAQNKKLGADYLPLTVDYEEKFYATGHILGSRYTRREGKPSDDAILSGRIVDRTLRPLFDQWIRNEIQIVVTVLALDHDDPDALSVIGASLALGVSEIPFGGPVSAVRVGKHANDGYQINPTYIERENERYEIDLIACGKDGMINMIECAGDEAKEERVIEALRLASSEIEKVNVWQKKIIAEIGKKKLVFEKPEVPETIKSLFAGHIAPIIKNYVMSGKPGHEGINGITEQWMSLARAELPENEYAHAASYIDEKIDELIHEEVLRNNARADGRGLDEIRPLFAQAGGLSSVVHGSGLFYRGGTHILSVLTLGGPSDALLVEGLEEKQGPKKFMHHYNFPPFSTGETGKIMPNRRAIGHGALAEKALLPMIPSEKDFPYTIRIVSEALSSNGSTSMGSVCASTLALMDGGVPIKKPVAGIASGLITDGKTYKLLIDIQGPEDHFGDMDFKVAGTEDGITAIQMDVKVSGVPIQVLETGFRKAKAARHTILQIIKEAIAAPRADIAPSAPKIVSLMIKPSQIGGIIGKGGETIKKIQERTGADAIDIEDDGTVYITGKHGSAEKAKAVILKMTEHPEIH